uniref:NADH dehydrogenase subunit 6 n=1 Tax=Echyridella menziesii TaxID=981778 RepID=A0A1Y9T624_9BIVA|nr:NADH dehydrogenase subunit 6 [Echyridella menziesii]
MITLLALALVWAALLLNLISLKHPLPLTINIMVLALLMSVNLSSLSSWYAFMMFLVFVGGMLMMFLYVSSMSPNAVFSMSPKGLVTVFQTLLTALAFTALNKTNTHTNSLKMEETLTSVTTYYTTENMWPLMFMCLILLMTVILVVKMVKSVSSPLRPYKTSM